MMSWPWLYSGHTFSYIFVISKYTDDDVTSSVIDCICAVFPMTGIGYAYQQNGPLSNIHGTFLISHSTGIKSQKIQTCLYFMWLAAKHGVNDTSVTVDCVCFHDWGISQLGPTLSSQLPLARHGDHARDMVIPLLGVIKPQNEGLELPCVCIWLYDISWALILTQSYCMRNQGGQPLGNGSSSKAEHRTRLFTHQHHNLCKCRTQHRHRT